MEELREKMYEYIEMYGTLDPRTVAISQKLDVIIVESMKKVNKHEASSEVKA